MYLETYWEVIILKKKIIVGIIIVLLIILLIPFPLRYKDGGTVEYRAVLYSVTNYHSIKADGGFYTGIEIKIIGKTVYDNTTFDN
jgi:hypothetical protein